MNQIRVHQSSSVVSVCASLWRPPWRAFLRSAAQVAQAEKVGLEVDVVPHVRGVNTGRGSSNQVLHLRKVGRPDALDLFPVVPAQSLAQFAADIKLREDRGHDILSNPEVDVGVLGVLSISVDGFDLIRSLTRVTLLP